MVRAGDVFKTERIPGEADTNVELRPVLAISDGTALTVGTPEVAGARVVARIVKQVRGPKLIAYKKKRRKGYERKIGHRQELTVLKIESIA